MRKRHWGSHFYWKKPTWYIWLMNAFGKLKVISGHIEWCCWSVNFPKSRNSRTSCIFRKNTNRNKFRLETNLLIISVLVLEVKTLYNQFITHLLLCTWLCETMKALTDLTCLRYCTLHQLSMDSGCSVERFYWTVLFWGMSLYMQVNSSGWNNNVRERSLVMSVESLGVRYRCERNKMRLSRKVDANLVLKSYNSKMQKLPNVQWYQDAKIT